MTKKASNKKPMAKRRASDDFEWAYRPIIIALIIGSAGFQFNANNHNSQALSDLQGGQNLIKQQMDQMSKKQDGAARQSDVDSLTKRVEECLTKDDAEQLTKTRDMQLGGMQRQIDSNGARLTLLESKSPK